MAKLTELTNEEPDFYPTLGPFLASRAVHHAVGGPIWDDDTKTWLVATDRHGNVTGFISVAAHGTPTVESLYTAGDDPDLAARLVAAAVKRFGSRTLRATVRHPWAVAYEKAGFTTVDRSANFTKLIREAK